MIRKPSVAGAFYPGNKRDIVQLIEKCLLDPDFGPGDLFNPVNKGDNDFKNRKYVGGVSPHAGYVYSGPAATFTYKKIFEESIPDTVIVLGTQHTGYYDIAIMKEGKWETPLGMIDIDTELASSILEKSKVIKEDISAFSGFRHGREHNIEVQLPFIQYFGEKGGKNVKFVPIKVGSMKMSELEELGADIAYVVQKSGKDCVVVASSDMTHKQPSDYYHPQNDLKEMRERDMKVIEAIKTLDYKDTFKFARQTTVCGPQTITTMLIFSKEVGCSGAEFLKYYNSYEKMGGSGPCEYSVGYLSAVAHR